MMNDPWSQERARNKILQLEAARACGWRIPRTVCTNNPSAVTATFERSDEVIYKPLTWLATETGEVLFANVIPWSSFEAHANAIRVVPGIYQERIAKACEYRVTVVAGELFAVRIFSQARNDTKLDWRRNQFDVEYEVCTLPDQVGTAITQVMNDLDLVFGAFDLIEDPAGEFVFLEVNPAGNWLWLEQRLHIPISDRIASFLAGH